MLAVSGDGLGPQVGLVMFECFSGRYKSAYSYNVATHRAPGLQPRGDDQSKEGCGGCFLCRRTNKVLRGIAVFLKVKAAPVGVAREGGLVYEYEFRQR